ncbi:MAG TPA: translocation/assembly module TamB domain-containing protein [Flavobacteriaceae bacterium]|nr:translocation/assembly module TamB domain-containing protein [Flavobacteriaceae bacterium]
MAILLLFLILVLVFSIPAVQTSVAGKLINNLNETYDVNMHVEKLGLSYDGTVWLEEVLILDHHKDTLIYSDEVRTSILSLSGILSGNPVLGNAAVDNLVFDIRRYKGEKTDNFGIFTSKFQTDTLKKKKDFLLSLDHAIITDGEFSYTDENLDSPLIIGLDSLNIDASNFNINGSKISVSLNTLNAKEKRGLEIQNLSTDFSYSPTGMKAENLKLRTPTSSLNADVVLDYTLENFSDFENEVDFQVVFDESKISLQDLNQFYTGFGDDESLVLKGKMDGTLNDFVLSDFHLNGMARSVVDGKVHLEGLFSGPENFKVTGDFDQLSSNYYDLVGLLPEVLQKLPTELRTLGNIRLEGFAEVTSNTLQTESTIFTQLGNAVVDLRLGDLNDPDFISYKGSVRAKRFNLGRLLGSEALGTTSFSLKVDGVGFSEEAINTSIQGKISGLTFNDYRYKNIEVLGVLRNSVFNGKITADDPNAQFEFTGMANISSKVNNYNFDLGIEYADLHAINLVERDTLSIFKGNVAINMTGTNVNNLWGTILFTNTSYQNARDTYIFEKLKVTSSFDDRGERTIEVNSPDVISGKVEGKFDLTEIPALFHNSVASLYTNYKPTVITTNQYLSFDFDIYNKIVEVFFPKIELDPGTFIRGSVSSDESEFKLTFKSPKIKAFENTLREVNVQVDNANPLFNMFVEVDSVSTGVYNISDFNLINVTLRDTLFIRTEFTGGNNNDDEFNLSLYHTINPLGKSVVGIRKSDIKFKESVWYLNEGNNASNRIIFDNNFKDIQVDSLVMSHKNEEIRLSGVKRDTTYKNFKIAFQNVDLNKVTPSMDSLQLGGTINGDIHLLQEKGVYLPRTSLTIDSVSINDVSYGDLALNIEGNESLTNYDVNAILKNEEYDFLKAVGNIDVSGEHSSIDLDVDLEKFKLSAFSAMGKDVISDIRGLVSGHASVTGNYKNPDIEGKLLLENAGMRIPYLNVDFDFEDNAEIDLNQQKFTFDNMPITDTKYGTEGILSGNISHENFKKWRLDLNVSTERLLVLDTEASETSLYYGTAFIEGNASITGPTDELVINVDATTEKGTSFKIPLNDTQAIGDNSYIYFLSPDEKTAKLSGKDIFIEEAKGMEINFDLNVTRDALVEIVIDKVNGSTLKGRGAGILRIEINTNGKFNMWGDFVVYDGVYNFKYAGVIAKEFEVEPGGSINWNGSPVRADLNVQAVYTTQANPAILLENPSFNRKIPVEVVITLEGQIVKPDISFDIQYPNLSSVVKSELEYKINDRLAKETQALALISSGNFYSETTLRQAPAGNLLEKASGLVNDIFADENGKFNLGLNYVQGDRSLDQSAADRVGVSVSTQISKNIVFNGQVGVPIGGVSESLVVGNVEISFLLNEEGTLRFKVFNRENNIQYIGEEIGYTQGAGIAYTVDFDTFAELVRKILNKEIKPEELEETVKATAEKSLAPDYIFTMPEEGN